MPRTAKPRASTNGGPPAVAIDHARLASLLDHGADPNRLRLLLILAGGEQHVDAMAQALDLYQPAVSYHLARLRHAGIVLPRRDQKRIYYALTDTGRALIAAIGALARGVS